MKQQTQAPMGELLGAMNCSQSYSPVRQAGRACSGCINTLGLARSPPCDWESAGSTIPGWCWLPFSVRLVPCNANEKEVTRCLTKKNRPGRAPTLPRPVN